jgi:hypothetical protein
MRQFASARQLDVGRKEKELPVVALRKEMKPNTWLEYISRCKSRMQTPEQYRAERVKVGAPIGCREKGERVASRRDPR